MKLKSILLIAAGILIASYPIVKNLYTGYMQRQILKDWEEERRAQLMNSSSFSSDIEDTSDVTEDAINSYISLDEAFAHLNDTEATEQTDGKVNNKSFVTLGVIKIDKIDLSLPVMDGTTPEILKVGAGKLTNTTDIGEVGNTAISAHRSHAYGSNFNRLNEVEEGDVVIISTLDADYIYEVFNIQIVEPDDVSLLKKSKTESILTLITCHPLYTASHRLIVQARLISTTVHSSETDSAAHDN